VEDVPEVELSGPVMPTINPLEDDLGSLLPVSVLPEQELRKDRHLASVGIVMAHGKVRDKILVLNKNLFSCHSNSKNTFCFSGYISGQL
jgi:hypothetical protein